VPDAGVMHDEFHVSKHLNEALDNVGRQEHKQLLAEGDETLKGSRQLWLYNPQNFNLAQASGFSKLKDLNLKVARAWAAKELFSKFWEYEQEGGARRFFKDWNGGISRSRLGPKIDVAQMLKGHLNELADLFEAPDHQRDHGRVGLENPEHQIGRTRLSKLQHNCAMGLRLCHDATALKRMQRMWHVFELPTQATSATALGRRGG
jgi:hypothetical protein